MLLFIVLLASACPGFAGDTLHVNTFNSLKLLKSGNVWLETGNIAGMVLNQSEIKASFEAGMDNGNGSFHRIREGNNYNNFSFQTESYQTQKKRLYIYGKFAYHYLDDTGGQWNGTYDPYNGNPYILADSVSGITYHKENYNLAGGVGYKLSEKISLGCGVDYYAGIAAKQKDPRPQNLFVRFKVNPAMIFHAENYRIGLDLGYSNQKEEIGYDVFRSNFSPTFFAFKGFGFYSVDIATGYDRFVKSNRFYGGVQYDKQLKGIPTLTEIRFDYNIESIDDGTSVVRKLDGGDWRTYNVLLNEHVTLINGLSRHLFKGNFSFFNGDGNEFTQNVVYQGTWNVPRYITISENLKFNRQTLSGSVNYNYQRMLDEDRLNWDIEANARYISNDESYYYIPEVFTATYSNVGVNLSVMKNIYAGKTHLAFSCNSGYVTNLSNELKLSALPEISKKQRKDVFLQEFDYYTSGLLKAGGEIKLGGSILKIKNAVQGYLSFRYDHIGQSDGNLSFNIVAARLGFIF